MRVPRRSRTPRLPFPPARLLPRDDPGRLCLSDHARRVVLTLAAAVGASVCAGQARAGDPTAVGVIAVHDDTALTYAATFRVTNAKAHGHGVSIAGNYAVMGNSTNWKFEGKHDVRLLEVTGATGVEFKMRGEHLVGPHPGEAAPNPLPEITSASVDLTPGAIKGVSAWAGADHPGEPDHIDLYSFAGEVRNRQVGATTSITSSVYVRGRHGVETSFPSDYPAFRRVCLRWLLNAWLVYDADTRLLSLSAGTPQVIDVVGCASGSVDPAYAADPIVTGTLSISPLLVQPMSAGGTFPVTGGDFALTADQGTASLLAPGRAPAVIVPGETITLLLERGTIVTDMYPDETPVSRVLADFASLNVAAQGIPSGPEGIFLRVETLTGDDVAAATQGFSTSVTLPVVLTLGTPRPPTGDCDSIDFNGDSLFPDTADIDDFLSVFSGGACSTGTCGDIDFNNDGLFPDTADVDALLSVFSGGPCL